MEVADRLVIFHNSRSLFCLHNSCHFLSCCRTAPDLPARLSTPPLLQPLLDAVGRRLAVREGGDAQHALELAQANLGQTGTCRGGALPFAAAAAFACCEPGFGACAPCCCCTTVCSLTRTLPVETV